MGVRDVLFSAVGRSFVNVEGEAEQASLQPPVSATRIAEIERELGFALPQELAALLHETAGLELLESVDLASIGRCPWNAPLGPVLVPCGDGLGNFWVVELRAHMESLGPVWFVGHEEPALVYQSPDLATFLDLYLGFQAAPHEAPLAEFLRQALRRVSSQTCDLPCADLLDSPDPVLRDFARRLGAGWFVRDLRSAQVGDGMPLARFGPKTLLARAQDEFVFAYGRRTPAQRLWTWVTGR